MKTDISPQIPDRKDLVSLSCLSRLHKSEIEGRDERRRALAFVTEDSWMVWNIRALAALKPDRIRELEIPVPTEVDCSGIQTFLTVVSRLKPVCLRDIPDQLEWDDELQHLCLGLLQCSRSLKHLKVHLTNWNRQPSWNSDHRFVKYEDSAFHFDKIFPNAPSEEQVEMKTYLGKNYVDPEDRTAPFQLESLGLEHFGIPEGAFGMIFGRYRLKNLSLSYCRYDSSIWQELQLFSQLKRLEGISYGTLDEIFMGFLKTQKTLEYFSFQEPMNSYEGDFQSWEGSTDMLYKLTEEVPALGPWWNQEEKPEYISLSHIRQQETCSMP